VFIPLFFGIGVGMALGNQFALAYLFFVLFGIWSISYWLTGDFLEKKRGNLRRRRIKRDPIAFCRAMRVYHFSKWGISVGLGAIGVGCLVWVHAAEIDYELRLLNGWLMAGHELSPFGTCSPEDDEVALYIGTNAVKTNNFPLTILKIAETSVLRLDRDSNGSLGIWLDIRSSDGRLIARIEKNHFTINQNNFLSMKRKDRSSLTIFDQYGTEVLNARYLNPHAFRLTAKLYYSGRFVDLSGIPIAGVCFSIQKGAKVASVLAF
jgi:hypothetical protein